MRFFFGGGGALNEALKTHKPGISVWSQCRFDIGCSIWVILFNDREKIKKLFTYNELLASNCKLRRELFKQIQNQIIIYNNQSSESTGKRLESWE